MLNICHWVTPAKFAGSSEPPVEANSGPSAILSTPPRCSMGEANTVVHNRRPLIATALGAAPTRIRCTEFDLGSMRATAPLRLTAAHAAPAPYATPRGASPTFTLVDTPLAGSKRVTERCVAFATQTLPRP